MKKKQEIEVISGPDAEGVADVRVCSTTRTAPDDLEGECDICHQPLFYRPEPPYIIRFVCLKCVNPFDGKMELKCTPSAVEFLTRHGMQVKIKT